MATPAQGLSGVFETPQQKPSMTQRIGRALMGFGAGYEGRGAEFIRETREQDQQLELSRQKAMAQDAMRVYGLLNQGSYDDALSLIDARVKAINELGGDPSDTLEIRQLITAGRIPEAAQELETFLGQAVQYGLIEPPKAPELLETTPQGQAIMRLPNGQVVALDVQGFRQAPEKPTDAMRTLAARAQAAGLEEGTPEYQSFMAQGGRSGGGESESAREREIRDIMETFGMSRREAITKLGEKTFIDPTTGNIVSYDAFTGSGRLPELDIPGQSSTALPPERRVEFEDLAFDPGKGTGFASSFLGAWNSTVGQLPFMPISTERSQAAQNLRILERDAINALATSSRPAVVEQERIIQALPRAMEWFENPDDARMKMTSFIDLMTNQYVDDMRYASNLRNPRALREESARRASEVERIMSRVLTPEAATQMMQSINRVERATESIRSMSESDLQSVDPSQLNDMELDVYIERLRSGGR